jgi:hypothetical protein
MSWSLMSQTCHTTGRLKNNVPGRFLWSMPWHRPAIYTDFSFSYRGRGHCHNTELAQKNSKITKPIDITIHWKALEEHFLMVCIGIDSLWGKSSTFWSFHKMFPVRNELKELWHTRMQTQSPVLALSKIQSGGLIFDQLLVLLMLRTDVIDDIPLQFRGNNSYMYNKACKYLGGLFVWEKTQIQEKHALACTS